jgi:phage baseplate assembly protein W
MFSWIKRRWRTENSMADILGIDLKLEDSDLSVADGDFELVSGVDCLKQDLLNAFLCPYFFWGMQIDFGSYLHEFVHGGGDEFLAVDLRAAVVQVLKAEPRVEPDSWTIKLDFGITGTTVSVEFQVIEWPTPESLQFIISNTGA